MIDASMIEVWAEEGTSPEQLSFILLFVCCCLYHHGYSKKNLNTSVGDMKNSSWKFWGLHKKEGIFSGDHASV